MPDLFSPFTLEDVTLRNRIVMSPMTMHRSPPDGTVTDIHLMLVGSWDDAPRRIDRLVKGHGRGAAIQLAGPGARASRTAPATISAGDGRPWRAGAASQLA